VDLQDYPKQNDLYGLTGKHVVIYAVAKFLFFLNKFISLDDYNGLEEIGKCENKSGNKINVDEKPH